MGNNNCCRNIHFSGPYHIAFLHCFEATIPKLVSVPVKIEGFVQITVTTHSLISVGFFLMKKK